MEPVILSVGWFFSIIILIGAICAIIKITLIYILDDDFVSYSDLRNYQERTRLELNDLNERLKKIEQKKSRVKQA